MISLGNDDMKFLRMKMQNGRPKHMWATQTAATLLLRWRYGKIVTLPMWAPPVIRRSNGINAICSGTTSIATTATNSQSRPLNFIHENAYAAIAPMPTDRITAGTVIFIELKKKWLRLALPGDDESTAS